jgi:hypothetical protein
MKKKTTKLMTSALIGVCLAIPSIASAAGVGDPAKPVMVNVDNFVRAETAAQFDTSLKHTGGAVNEWLHFRTPAPIDQQTVIRMNRDTLYSGAIVDISEGARLTVPDTGGRYLSIMVVNEDHYINKVIHEPGVHELTVKEFGTPFVGLAVRTLVDASDPEDIRKANALQDKLKIEAASAKPYTHPNYDKESYKTTYDALLVLGRGMPDARATFGSKEDVDPVRHLLGTAWGWGGLPQDEAYYLRWLLRSQRSGCLQREQPDRDSQPGRLVYHPLRRRSQERQPSADCRGLELYRAPLPAAKGDSRWNLDLPRRETGCSKVADQRAMR